MSDPQRQDLPDHTLTQATTAHAILTTDLQGRIQTWNAGAEHLLGYEAGEMIGQSAGRLFPPEELNGGPFGAEMRAARVTGHVDSEGWLVRKDGTRLWTAGHTLVLHDKTGAEVGFAKFIRDGTASRERGLEPADAELRFRTLVEQVRDFAIFLVDTGGYNTSWNEGAQRLLGYDPAEFIGQYGAELFPPEDRERGEYERELDTAVREGCASDDRWLVRKNGSRFWASGVTTRLNDSEGRHIGFSKVLRDLTADKVAQDRLRDSEERLRAAIAAARMGTWRWHVPTNTQRVDGSMSRLLGLGEGEVAETYELFREHIHPEDRERVDAAFSYALQGGGLDVEFRVVWPDGTIRWLSDHGLLIPDEHGRPEYLTGAVIDITERKAAEERLIQVQRMDAVGQLAGGVAHEINNMMTAVLGFSELLLNQLRPSDPARTDVAQIRKAAGRAAMITGQLLAFSRQRPLEARVVDLNRLVADLEPMLRRLMGEDKLVVLDLSPGLGHVRADPGSLEQVILNLAINARDAMPSGGTLTLATRAETIANDPRRHPDAPQPGPHVVLSVADTGHGMDQGTRAKVFEPFFTTKDVGQGTGLGLAVVQGIVNQSGGTIRLESAVGRGTTFDIYLPETDQPLADAGVPEGEEIEIAPGTRSVLVVEDEELVRDFTCRLINAEGYRCLQAANGAEALEWVRERGDELDLILTDVVMPVMGGRELAKQVTRLRPGLPVLYMSAYSAEEVGRRGLLPPDVPFVQKPFTPTTLAQKLRELLPR
jgi:two-component system, cell cycle sensor histidine kinase and response regulator CckA